MPSDATVVINCAGVGSRLGFGMPKSLLKFGGYPLIYYQLKLLDAIKDVRIVVGFQAKALIETVLKYRKNVAFVFNHNYLHSNTLQSLYMGSLRGNDQIISLDGDLLVHPLDMALFTRANKPLLGIAKRYTDDPVYAIVEENGAARMQVVGFLRKPKQTYEWTGLVRMHKKHILNSHDYVYETIEPQLPISATVIRCHEVDTADDYENALRWYAQNYN